MERASTTRPVRTIRRGPARRFGPTLALALLVWIAVDVFGQHQHSIRQFDPIEVARLETAMWRSYYARNAPRLFWQMAGGLRSQFHAPFWRSFGLAYQATKAAFVFKRGASEADYARALPTLTTYYQSIQNLTEERFDVPDMARLELNWWVVHRQRDRYSYDDLAQALAQTAGALYNLPANQFVRYGQLRADAMRLCDEAGRKPGGATNADWQRIEEELTAAWGELHTVVQPK